MRRVFAYPLCMFFILSAALIASGCTTNEGTEAPAERLVEHIKPEGLFNTAAYTQVVASNGGRTIYISGQVPFDKEGKLIGKDDFNAQVRQVFENLQTALASAGADFNNVVKVTYFIKNYKQEQLPVIREMRAKYFDKDYPPASSLIGVQSLFLDDVLIEVEAVAVMNKQHTAE
ncbi:MAG TPA: RidA family protein [Ignavibacteriales bacterium]|nr:RidA family protein [Ignavibacteriales bacterium]HEX3074276.1 RidA family protein [Ignavibacteriales bacterium]